MAKKVLWIVLFGLLAASYARANGESWTVNGIVSVGCAHAQTRVSHTLNLPSDNTIYQFLTETRIGSAIYMNEFFEDTGYNYYGTYRWYIGSAIGSTAPYPIPAGVDITTTMTLRDANGTPLWRTTLVWRCDTPQLISNVTESLAPPTPTPETPTATPETPTATPETPTVTPETPTATPETPTVTPETPTATPEVLQLRLTSMCSPDPASYRVWRVRNPNPFPVNFSWSVYNTAQSGSGTAAASSDTFFQTSTVSGPNTTLLLVEGVQQDVKASTPAACAATSTPWRVTDNRLNADPAAPAVVYCMGNGLHLYSVDEHSAGTLALVITPEMIAAVGVPTSNTLLGQAAGFFGDIAVYRLTTGEFQLVAGGQEAGSTYTFIWSAC